MLIQKVDFSEVIEPPQHISEVRDVFDTSNTMLQQPDRWTISEEITDAIFFDENSSDDSRPVYAHQAPEQRDDEIDGVELQDIILKTNNEIAGKGAATTKKVAAPGSNPLCNLVWKRYFALKLVGTFLALYTALLSFTYRGALGKAGGLVDRESGFIIDVNNSANNELGVILSEGVERAVVAASSWEMICLGIAKLSAFFMYPALGAVFITKFRATMEFVSHTPLSLFTYEDLHELHVFSGWVVLTNSMAHVAFHLLRWASQGNLSLLGKHFSGVSGLVIAASLLLICLPMLFAKNYVRYEVRKMLHYFFVFFAVGLCFHAPTSAFPNGGFSTIMFAVLIIWWILDYTYTFFFMTEKIESSLFHVVPTGVQLTMRVSDRFRRHEGGYCYVNFPWISKYEWHAFSLFENPSRPEERQIFIQKVGDWTTKLHTTLKRETSRPVWVQGPYSSPFDSAVEYDNQILVAGGIGITPAVSVMRAHKNTRRTNLIWTVRDPHMLEFFLRRAEFSVRGWNMVFYTGKEPTAFDTETEVITNNGARVHIIRGRPDFRTLIPNLIYSIESEISVPEAYIPDSKFEALEFLKERLCELEDDDETLTNRDKIRILTSDAENLGLLFSDLASELYGDGVSDARENSLRRESSSRTFHRNANASGNELLTKIRGISRQSASRNVFESSRSLNRQLSISHFDLHRASSIRELANTRSKRHLCREDSVHSFAWRKVSSAIDQWAKDHSPAFKPWEDGSAEAIDFVNGMDPEELRCWGVLFCGGKSSLAANVAKFSAVYEVSCHMESFAW